MSALCRLGYEEHDGYRYCFAHGGFAHYMMFGTLTCDRAPRLDPPGMNDWAGAPGRCATCDGGGCPDCTDGAS